MYISLYAISYSVWLRVSLKFTLYIDRWWRTPRCNAFHHAVVCDSILFKFFSQNLYREKHVRKSWQFII